MRARRTAAAVVMALSIVNVAVFVTAVAGTEELLQHLVFGPVLLAYPAVALVILWQRNHPVGWLLLVLGMLLGPLDLVARLVIEVPAPPGSSAGWRFAVVASAIPFPLFATLLPALGLRFPEGRLLGPRWRYAQGLYVMGVAAVVSGMLLAPIVRGGPAGGPSWFVGNPLSEPWTEPLRGGLELVALVSLLPAIVLALVSVVLRFRRSSGLERQQMRWLTYPVFGVLLTWAPAAGAAHLVAGAGGTAVIAGLYSMLVLAVPAVGIGIAVTRYRLYELDRILSRTITYALVIGALAALYAAGVIGIGSVLRPIAGESDLVVALSTLLVAAAFQPSRRRIQAFVDRRFSRHRYDAGSVVATFARSVRDEVDVAALRRDVHLTVKHALAPTSVSVWVPEATS